LKWLAWSDQYFTQSAGDIKTDVPNIYLFETVKLKGVPFLQKKAWIGQSGLKLKITILGGANHSRYRLSFFHSNSNSDMAAQALGITI